MLIKTKFEPPELDSNEIANHFVTSIYNQVMKLKYNYIGMVVGKPRAGKSIDTTTLNCLVDGSFWENLEKRIVYDANGFMRGLNYIAKTKTIGAGLMWDEAGVGMPARQWYDISNRAISFAVQVMGVYRPIVWFVTQDITYIDSQPRKLINALYEVTRSSNEYSKMRVYNISINRKTGKMYFKYPRMITQEKLFLKMSKGIKIMKPPKELIQRYEEHSKPFKEKIMRVMEQRTEDFESGLISKKEYSVAEIIQTIMDHKTNYEAPTSEIGKRRFHADLISHDFGIPQKLANVIKLRAEQLTRKTEKPESEKEFEIK